MASDQTVPIMDSYGYKGVAFLVVDWTGSSNPVWAHVIQEGWEIGCHSWTHPPDMNQLSASQLIHETTDAKAWLEQAFGVNIISFAYPGSMGWNNATVLQALSNAGFLYARDGGWPPDWTGQRSLQVLSWFCDASAYTSEIQSAINAANQYGISVAGFHGVYPNNDPPSWGTLIPDQFRYCLTQIKNAGLTPITFKEWDQMKYGTPTPPGSTYKIDVSIVGQGSVVRSATEPYVYGQAVSLTATAQAGYSFQGWTGDLTGSTNPVTLVMAKNMTVTATFTANPLPPSSGQIAVSSVSASSNDGYHVPNMAIDGIENPSNYWGTDATVPQGRVPQWLKLDLGTAYSINTVITHFYDGSVRTYTYYIQVSNDGSSWTTIVPTKTGSGSVTDTFSQVGARFVRITVTANTANPAAHIEEIKVYGSSSGPTPPPPSSGQIAVSSVSASSNDGYHVPNMAIDGIENPSNYWGTDATVPQGRVPQWLKLDLGSVYSINTVITHFYDGSVRTYTYYLEVSNDGSSWTMVVPARSGSGLVTDTFSQVGARFVRITVTANTANPAAHIEEIKVYGPS
jgi:uncharacterized repeat protein (TIGR02543 family)